MQKSKPGSRYDLHVSQVAIMQAIEPIFGTFSEAIASLSPRSDSDKWTLLEKEAASCLYLARLFYFLNFTCGWSSKPQHAPHATGATEASDAS